MLKILPFVALTPIAEAQQSLPCYGSGKMSQEYLERLARENADSFIRVIKPQYIEPNIEQGSAEFYARSFYHFQKIMERGLLEKQVSAVYIYEQEQPNNIVVRGFVVSVSAKSILDGSLKKHENTLEILENRLVKQITALKSMAEPVLLVQKLPDSLTEYLINLSVGKPLVETIDDLNHVHRLWPITSASLIESISNGIEKLGSLYIADGHHRMSAVGKYLDGLDSVDPLGLMVLLVNEQDMIIKSFHRIISGIGDIDFLHFFTHKQAHFWIISDRELDAITVSTNCVLLLTPSENIMVDMGFGSGECNTLTQERTVDSGFDAVEKLEVNKIESLIFDQLMGIHNTINDDRITFMRGDTPLQTMKKLVLMGSCDCVLVLPANTVQQIRDVADQNLFMPPKSTWIEPKLLTGFITQVFD